LSEDPIASRRPVLHRRLQVAWSLSADATAGGLEGWSLVGRLPVTCSRWLRRAFEADYLKVLGNSFAIAANSSIFSFNFVTEAPSLVACSCARPGPMPPVGGRMAAGRSQ